MSFASVPSCHRYLGGLQNIQNGPHKRFYVSNIQLNGLICISYSGKFNYFAKGFCNDTDIQILKCSLTPV